MRGNGPHDNDKVSNPARRRLLKGSLGVGTSTLIPLVQTSCSTPVPVSTSPLGVELEAVLTAVADRLFPADELSASASALGAIAYINRSLLEWNQADVATLTAGLRALNQVAISRHGQAFVLLTVDQQDALLIALEGNELPEIVPGSTLFNRIHRLVLEGIFSDPFYGGNKGFQGWDLIGYPGAVLASTPEMQQMGQRLPALHTSAYGAEHDGH